MVKHPLSLTLVWCVTPSVYHLQTQHTRLGSAGVGRCSGSEGGRGETAKEWVSKPPEGKDGGSTRFGKPGSGSPGGESAACGPASFPHPHPVGRPLGFPCCEARRQQAACTFSVVQALVFLTGHPSRSRALKGSVLF